MNIEIYTTPAGNRKEMRELAVGFTSKPMDSRNGTSRCVYIYTVRDMTWRWKIRYEIATLLYSVRRSMPRFIFLLGKFVSQITNILTWGFCLLSSFVFISFIRISESQGT
jgi:hypothetical protein